MWHEGGGRGGLSLFYGGGRFTLMGEGCLLYLSGFHLYRVVLSYIGKSYLISEGFILQ